MSKKQHTTTLPDFENKKSETILRSLSFALIAVVSVFLSIRHIYGEDIPFHLNAGRWIIENMTFPDKDMFTYTASEHQYIDMNWLYQVFMYGVYSVGGSTGLILMNSLIVLGSVIVLFKRCSTSHSNFLPWLMLLAVLAISPSLEIRPHSVSWLFLSLILYLLQEYDSGNQKAIRWLPAVMILWVNCHSLFILGLAVIGCYGITILLKRKDQVKKYATWSALAVLACFINPYGWNGFAFPFEQVFYLQSGDIFKENIRELQSPFKITEYALTLKNIFLEWHFFDLFVLASAISLLLRYKKMQIHEWLITIIFFYFAYSATKNIGYFIFAVTPIIASSFAMRPSGEKQKRKNKHQTIPFSNKLAGRISIALILITLLLILSIRSNAFYIHYRAIYRFGLDWSNSNLPVKATEFLLKNELNGRILNQLDPGGYLEFFTRQKVSIDGRLEVMGQELFAEQVNAVSPEAKAKLIEKYNPDIILFSYFLTPDWIKYLISRPDWRLVYVDESTAVYLKNGYAPALLAVDDKIFTSSIPQYTDVQIDTIVKNKKGDSFITALFNTQYYPDDELNKVLFCIYYGWIPAAKQITVSGFEKSTQAYPELYQNLGTIYYEFRDKQRTLFYYEKFLQTRENEYIRKRVDYLKSL